MATPKTSAALKGKKVVVIGGSSGLGFATASALIEEGAHVILGSSSESRVQSAIEKLSDPKTQYNADPSRVSGHAVNLKGAKAEESLKQFFSKVGPFDHLVYTAGDSLATKPLSERTYEDIVEAGSVRFISAVLAVKVATSDPNLLRQNAGSSIILTTGTVAEKPIKDWNVVGGYAAGLYGLTRGLAFDLMDKGIRVNCVSPGPVETELWNGIPEQQRTAFLNDVGSKLMTGTIGKPEDVAQTYLALLKDKNVNAQIVLSDGGSTVGQRT